MQLLKNEETYCHFLLLNNSKNDIKIAKNIARELVMEYGMGDRIMPSDDETRELLERIRSEVNELIDKMRSEIDALAKFLLENESASRADVIMIIQRINNG